MKINKVLITVFVVILLGVYTFYTNSIEQKDMHETAFDDLKLHLVGVVYDIDPVESGYYHGFGIIRVKIISSDIQEYDQSQSKKYFYCTIKKGSAEIYEHTAEIFVGDTLSINTRKGIISVNRKGVKVSEGDISLCSVDGYYDYIKKHKQ
jgi:hypothetical protein